MSGRCDLGATDAVVKPITPQIVELSPAWRVGFHRGTFGRDESVERGVTISELLIAACIGPADLEGLRDNALALWSLDR